MSEDWDLFAVVRSCSSWATTNISPRAGSDDDDRDDTKPQNPLSCLEGLTFEDEHQEPFLFPGFDFGQKNNSRDRDDSSCNELQDSCKPFLLPPPTSSCCSSSSSSVSAVSASYCSTTTLGQEQRTEQDRRAVGLSVLIPASAATTSSSPVFVFRSQREELQQQQQQQQQLPQVLGRSRKRKNQQKRTICHVTQENLSSDMWAWRKYGQKPIKGSPYPRNYYRCSSSKGCLARKQVERSNLDPDIFIVTYTGEHTHPRPTHRNSLAGSTRNKPQPANPSPKSEPTGQPHDLGTAAARTENLSPTTPLKEHDDVQGTNADEDIVSQEICMGDEEEVVEEEEEDDDVDVDDDDVDGLLIPNLSARDHREDLFSNMQGFAGTFPSWSAGGSSAADDRDGGGG